MNTQLTGPASVVQKLRDLYNRWLGEPGEVESAGARRRRNERRERETREDALNENLVGLAFSGGGIRSATFNLGVLQGLAELSLLKHFDYLSSVSGGGYIASWFAAWVRRESSLNNVEKQLRLGRVKQAAAFRRWEGKHPPERIPRGLVREEEPEPIYHLRTFSNYLAPRSGVLSVDSWVLLAIYLRNLVLNQLILLPAVLALVLASRYMLLFYKPAAWRELLPGKESLWGWYDFLAGLMIGLAFGAFFWSSSLVRPLRERKAGDGRKSWLGIGYLTVAGIAVVRTLFMLPPGRRMLDSGFAAWPLWFVPAYKVGSAAAWTDPIVWSGAVLGVFTPDIVVWAFRRVRRFCVGVWNAFRDQRRLGPTPRDGELTSGEQNEIRVLQFRVLLPFVAASVLFVQQFVAGTTEGLSVVGSPWLKQFALGGDQGPSWLLEMRPRWAGKAAISMHAARALAYGAFVGALYAIERLLVLARDAWRLILAMWRRSGAQSGCEASRVADLGGLWLRYRPARRGDAVHLCRVAGFPLGKALYGGNDDPGRAGAAGRLAGARLRGHSEGGPLRRLGDRRHSRVVGELVGVGAFVRRCLGERDGRDPVRAIRRQLDRLQG